MKPETEQLARKLGVEIGTKRAKWMLKEYVRYLEPHPDEFDPLDEQGWDNSSEEWAIAELIAHNTCEAILMNKWQPKRVMVEIVNDFHNTATTIKTLLDHEPTGYVARLSANQIKTVKHYLCGIPDCTCGGIRGRQEHEGIRMTIDTSAEWES